MKYPLLFENINKSTTPNHPDREDVDRCKQRSKDILTFVNQRIKESENIARLEELAKKIEDKRQFSDHSSNDKPAAKIDEVRVSLNSVSLITLKNGYTS